MQDTWFWGNSETTISTPNPSHTCNSILLQQCLTPSLLSCIIMSIPTLSKAASLASNYSTPLRCSKLLQYLIHQMVDCTLPEEAIYIQMTKGPFILLVICRAMRCGGYTSAASHGNPSQVTLGQRRVTACDSSVGVCWSML